MLYIIQMIVSGRLAQPRVFTDPTSARKAFIALVREHCTAAFADYCAAHAADPESFATAREFATAWDAAEVGFGYWELAAEADAVAAMQGRLPTQNREPVLKAAVETQQQVLGVQAELRGLTEKLTGMSQELIRLRNLLGDAEEETAGDEGSGAADLSTPEVAPLEEKYQTDEWRNFVQSLIRMCGGSWCEFPLLSRQDWRHAVYGSQTTLQYWEWAAMTIDQAIERARTCGYTVEEDGERSGYFAYLTPTGERDSSLYEMEDLAWCAAGLHAAQAAGAPD